MIIIFKEKLVKYYFSKVDGLYLNGQNVSAIKMLDKILRLDKNNVEAWCYKGLCYSNVYDKENSFKCFEIALNIGSSDSNIYFNWGIACTNLDEDEMALKFYKELLKENPDDLLLLRLVGGCYLFINNIDEALFYFNKVLSQRRDHAILVYISKCYKRLEDYGEALEYLDEALKINDNSAFALMEKCEICIIYEKFENALSCVNKTLKLKPNCLLAIIKKNYILFKLKRYDEALNGFKKISKMTLEDSAVICDYYLYYGEILQDMKKYGEALDLYEEYLEKYPYFPKDDILEEKEEVLKLLKE